MKQIVALLLLFISANALAETSYITDQFKVTMRSGESSEYRVVRMLPSGTAVEVINRSAESGYSHVRAQGSEGYILTRQLLNEPIAREQLSQLKAEIVDLSSAPDQLKRKLIDLTKQHKALTGAHKELKEIKGKLEQELNGIRRTAANAIRISEERNELGQQVAALTRSVEDLKQENRDLTNQSDQNWFLIGAAVIIGGILIGLILPHLRFQRRKSSWNSL
ncbi:MAG: TIGR04211 family SH3 domain-containing protein [Candidatus Polarisedimenticolaceae bacterium]|nr:TIGR04211 family SH3 domain-containing protein [Candidatus Polarisedimenticolaceae bacterium]